MTLFAQTDVHIRIWIPLSFQAIHHDSLLRESETTEEYCFFFVCVVGDFEHFLCMAGVLWNIS